jgi:thioredoxin 1
VTVKEFNNQNFQSEVLESTGTVLIDFWAPGCGPCRQITPMIEELAIQFQGQAKVGKVNASTNNELASSFGIDAVPTLVIFKKGKETKRFVGVPNKFEIQEALTDPVIVNLEKEPDPWA